MDTVDEREERRDDGSRGRHGAGRLMNVVDAKNDSIDEDYSVSQESAGASNDCCCSVGRVAIQVSLQSLAKSGRRTSTSCLPA